MKSSEQLMAVEKERIILKSKPTDILHSTNSSLLHAHMWTTLDGLMCIHMCIYTWTHTHLCITVIVTNLREQGSGEGSPLDYYTFSSLAASIKAL